MILVRQKLFHKRGDKTVGGRSARFTKEVETGLRRAGLDSYNYLNPGSTIPMGRAHFPIHAVSVRAARGDQGAINALKQGDAAIQNYAAKMKMKRNLDRLVIKPLKKHI